MEALSYELWFAIALEMDYTTLWRFGRIAKLAYNLLHDDQFLRAYYRRYAPPIFHISQTPPAPWYRMVQRIPILRHWSHVPNVVMNRWPNLEQDEYLCVILARDDGVRDWYTFSPLRSGYQFYLSYRHGSKRLEYDRPLSTLRATLIDVLLTGTRENGIPLLNPPIQVQILTERGSTSRVEFMTPNH